MKVTDSGRIDNDDNPLVRGASEGVALGATVVLGASVKDGELMDGGVVDCRVGRDVGWPVHPASRRTAMMPPPLKARSMSMERGFQGPVSPCESSRLARTQWNRAAQTAAGSPAR
jgi:hypothetical protein